MQLLNTPRLVLDYAVEEDAAFLYKLMNDVAFIKYVGDKNIKTIEDAENYIKDKFLKSYRENGYGYYIIKLKDNLVPIGICGLVNREEMKFIDIGYALLSEFRNKGFAFEATQALFDYAQETLKIKDVVAIVDANNFASINLIEKLGLSYQKNIKLPNEVLACQLYGIKR